MLDTKPCTRLETAHQGPRRQPHSAPEPRGSIRICSKCGEAKPVYAFAHRRKQCKTCIKAISASRYAANKEAISLKAKARYAENPEPTKTLSAKRYAANPKAVNDYSAAWQKNNPDKVYVRNSKWKSANGDKVRLAARERYKANREREIARVQWRHSRTRSPIFGKPITIGDIMEIHGASCYICGVTTDRSASYKSLVKTHMDHVVPLAKGGAHTVENLRCACRRCNILKGARHTPEEVRAILGIGG
jgi:5-methylcytosine-specific restriction endonuclease McrA